MLGLYYFRWTGTHEELKEYVGRITDIANGIDGASFKGVFTPTSAWNGVLLFEGSSFDKVMEIYKVYVKNFGAHPRIPVAKVELLFSFEEVGVTV